MPNLTEEEKREFPREIIEIMDNHSADLIAKGFDPAALKVELTTLADTADAKEGDQGHRACGTRHRHGGEPGGHRGWLQKGQRQRGTHGRPAGQGPRALGHSAPIALGIRGNNRRKSVFYPKKPE